MRSRPARKFGARAPPSKSGLERIPPHPWGAPTNYCGYLATNTLLHSGIVVAGGDSGSDIHSGIARAEVVVKDGRIVE